MVLNNHSKLLKAFLRELWKAVALPLLVPTPEGHVYWIMFVCDATCFWVVAYLKRKSDAFAAFQAYKGYAENCLGLRIKATHDNKGGEYIGKDYNNICAQHSIQCQHAEPDELHQNSSKLPPSFWGHAISTFVHTHNCMPTSALGGAVPYTAWKGKGRKPDVSYFHTFGCLAYMLVHKKDRKALEPHSRKCIFVGYPEGTKAWWFWDPTARRFIISLYAVFDEHCFPGNSPSIDIFGLPLDEVDIPGDPATADKPPEDVPDAPELPDQGETTGMILHLLHLLAAQDEIQSLMENQTFELVQLPLGRKAIGSSWVFRVKRNADGSIERYKGHLITKGFSQRPGFDYNETFAPTPKWALIRAILALAALEDLELESVDIPLPT
ncbi:hypothetical protein BN946_scf184683.g1 [Trametes cinnabarina]|uniref:Uncharacterized protein n=1 Tax=Pycnoporus cinnabarinus TaxID=5643 RepID=A0A060T0P2_PYCCI|nr:hypothetical protein BN946_scf184683.g1 [Trametes cinnabarina]